jgi:hypothetical protein
MNTKNKSVLRDRYKLNQILGQNDDGDLRRASSPGSHVALEKRRAGGHKAENAGEYDE